MFTRPILISLYRACRNILTVLEVAVLAVGGIEETMMIMITMEVKVGTEERLVAAEEGEEGMLEAEEHLRVEVEAVMLPESPQTVVVGPPIYSFN